MIKTTPTIIKFGGTSVVDTGAFFRAAEIVAARIDLQPVVVVSAMGGFTDALVAAVQTAATGKPTANSLLEHLARHEDVAKQLPVGRKEFLSFLHEIRVSLDVLLEQIATAGVVLPDLADEVLACGELLSSNLFAAVLAANAVPAQAIDARKCIITDDCYGNAAPLLAETFQSTQSCIAPLLTANVVPVVGGFIGATRQGKTTTIGRGGSDYTAALVGAALRAGEIQIWTDVNGVLTADPRVVPGARTVKRLSYSEAAELAYFGAKVLHPKTIQPAIEGGIPVRICNSRWPEEDGTLVCATSETAPLTVKAIAHKKGVTTVQITSARMLGAYGFLRALFEIFERHRTVVDVVTTSEVSVSLSLDEPSELKAIVAELKTLGTVRVEPKRAIICVVGEGLRGTPGIAARVFNTISDINVTLISQGASSINLTFAIAEERVEEAVNRLHEAIFAVATSDFIAPSSLAASSTLKATR